MTIHEVVGALKEATVMVTAVAGLFASLAALRTGYRAFRAAEQAQEAARQAHTRATEAVREQINFALKRAAREAVAEFSARRLPEEERSSHEPYSAGDGRDGGL